METNFIILAQNAKKASIKAQSLSSDTKNRALLEVASAIDSNREKIFQANKLDLEFAKELVENGELSQSTFNRLKLDENKMRDMIQGIKDIALLDDPVNKNLLVRELDEGLTLYKVSCPIGVLGIIFEARPDVISQISALSIKSSNAVILKGGKESKNTNKTIPKLEVYEILSVNINNNVATTVGIIKIRPPIVGVPSFFLCDSPTNILIFCPTRNFFKQGTKNSPKAADTKKPNIIAKTAFVNSNIFVTPFLLQYYTISQLEI